METGDIFLVNRIEAAHHVASPTSENDDRVLERVNRSGALENVVKVDESGLNISQITEDPEALIAPVKTNGLRLTKESRVKSADHSKLSKLKGQRTNKSGDPPTLKQSAPTLVKKIKDVKDAVRDLSVSNGSCTSNSHMTQPLKIKSFDETHPVSAKLSGKQGTVTASHFMNAIQPEGLVEKVKVKPVKEEINIEEDAQLSIPMAEDVKTLRMGTLPAYSFSFKCHERAEKRREFYSNLEKKIHAKEEEKTTLQAKTQETQEAEIKMLRKSLKFKATPMPSFYQEPAPAKVELKKTPTTRPKSPKLGRKKDSHVTESDENESRMPRPGRLSLDEKLSSNNSPKGVSPIHLKKPLRKSLPKLPSQNTHLPVSKSEGPPRAPPTPEYRESQAEQIDSLVIDDHAQQPLFNQDQAQINVVHMPIASNN